MVERLTIACLLFAAACGPTALRDEGAGATLSLGGANRRIETLTDLEEVRDVVQVGGLVYAATDRGLFRFGAGGDAPGERVEGIPNDDVRALAIEEGAILVATGGGMVRLEGEQIAPVEGVPNLGLVTDLARGADGTMWLCGLGGVARRAQAGSWEVFGEPTRCTTLAPTPEGNLWVGTTAGLWYVEGDVIREHPIGGGMPEGYVRAIVPVLPGKIIAILQGPTDAKIAYWDAERWYAYTLRGLTGQVVGLIRRRNDVLLVTDRRVVELAPSGTGVPLVPLGSEEGNVRSFRARITPAAQHRPGELPSAEALLEPKEIAEIPESRASVEAPPFRARPLELELPGRAYGGFVSGDDAFLAIANAGVLRLVERGDPITLRTRSLVPDGELQLATDPAGTVWVLAREGGLTKLVNGRLRNVAMPNGLVPQAVAPGPQGAYLLALDPNAPSAVHVFTNPGAGWRPFVQRTLALPFALRGVPFIGVGPDRRVWAALSVAREDGEGSRVRGVAVIDPGSETVIYHHRGAVREQGGLEMPDEVSAVEFDTDGNAWFASLSGLVRIDSSQAVIFGESRGVRGEVVTDVAIANALIWVASAEGLGSYDRDRFDYAQPDVVERARPTRLATDLSGNLWAASSRGLLLRSGSDWTMLDADDGLPVSELADVEADASGRVWLLANDRVMVLER